MATVNSICLPIKTDRKMQEASSTRSQSDAKKVNQT